MRDVCVVGIHSIKFCLTKTPQHFRTVKRTKEKNKKSNDKSDSIAVKRIIIILRPYVEYFTVKKFPSFSVFNFRKKIKKIIIYICFYKIFYRLIKNILQLIFKLNLFFKKYIQFMILCKIFY
jgi:hypothetical protein